MKEEKDAKNRTRKVYASKGERAQKPMTFRLDNDLEEWLTRQVNKGRYINELIRTDMTVKSKSFQ